MKKIKQNNTWIYFQDSYANFYKKIKNKDYKILKILKNDKRSKVELIEVEQKKYVLKVPKEKNSRKWQRFISIFRGGESFREFKQLEKLRENGFNAPEPLLAMEVKKFSMTFDSFLILEYIESHEGTAEDIKIVSKCLDEIHKKGFLHGDSQLMNFLVTDNTVYLIDTKLLRNVYGKFGEMYEYIYLQESCPIDIKDYVDRSNIYFKVAKLFNGCLHFWVKTRKTIKKLIKNKG